MMNAKTFTRLGYFAAATVAVIIVVIICVAMTACGSKTKSESDSGNAESLAVSESEYGKDNDGNASSLYSNTGDAGTDNPNVYGNADGAGTDNLNTDKDADNSTENVTGDDKSESGDDKLNDLSEGNAESVVSDAKGADGAGEELSQEGSVGNQNSGEVSEEVLEPKFTVICLDPGHGGSSQGTHYEYDGVEIEEKNLNYYIATRVKYYLEQYDNIKVVIDRSENEDPTFAQRIQTAKDNGADYLISLHNNSKSSDDIEPRGCMAIMTCSHYQAESAVNSDIYGASRSLALSILSSLRSVGLTITEDWDANKTEGILQRVGNGTYPDGSSSDYYGLIRNATEAGIPSVIIEHAFLSNESDYRQFLSSNAKLDALAKADAQGIINFLNAQ